MMWLNILRQMAWKVEDYKNSYKLPTSIIPFIPFLHSLILLWVLQEINRYQEYHLVIKKSKTKRTEFAMTFENLQS